MITLATASGCDMKITWLPFTSVTLVYMMLNAYNKKTDYFLFQLRKEIPYDYSDVDGRRKIILEQFTGQSWRAAKLLDEVHHSKNFYFDKFCQIKMPSWTKGRVALIGDAGYCASPAAGMGASLAVSGAGALADALHKEVVHFRSTNISCQ